MALFVRVVFFVLSWGRSNLAIPPVLEMCGQHSFISDFNLLDVGECCLNARSCHSLANCSVGSYECICNAGYSEIGTNCLDETYQGRLFV